LPAGIAAIPVPYPVIARAFIPRVAIFGVCTDREEDEVILDPRRLRQLKVTAP
jgi:hypothetical protein